MTRKTLWTLFTIAAALRVFMIGRAPLWYDENFTLILARLPFHQMIKATAGDVHPPLWYIIEWIIFHAAPGLPAWAIRVPALTFSLLAFVTFVQVCNSLYIPSRVQTVAAAMMAILPMQIWYAQEGRMYAMLEFLVLAALWTGLTRKWIWFFIASLAMLYTQNYGVFYLATIGFVLIIRDWQWQPAEPIITAMVAAALLYLPWVIVIARQMTEINGRYWIMDASAGAVLGSIYKQFWSSSMLAPGVVPSYVVTFVALILGIYGLTRERISSWWPVLALSFGPLGLAWLASLLWQPLLLFRPLIGISPFLYLVVAWPLVYHLFEIRYYEYEKPGVKLKRTPALFVSCFIAPLLILGIGGYYQNVAAMKGEGAVSPLLDTLDYVRAHWQPGDVIYYTDDGPMINLMPYTADLPQYRMPACDEKTGYAPVLGSLSDATREAIGSRIAEFDDAISTRAWVFAPRSPLHPTCYEDQIKDIAAGSPLILVDDNQYLTSGVWLVEAE
jgi:uncharacterized membrane protein